MKHFTCNKYGWFKSCTPFGVLFILLMVCASWTNNVLPDGYQQIGNTKLYYNFHPKNQKLQIIAEFDGMYFCRFDPGTTTWEQYSGIKVNDNAAVYIEDNFLLATTNNGVTCMNSIEPYGEYARVSYAVTNTNETDVNVSLGINIPNPMGNSNTSVYKVKSADANETVYGLRFCEGNNTQKQIYVLFGEGVPGATSIDDYWFGNAEISGTSTASNGGKEAVVGNYDNSIGNWMVEGTYKARAGWCWKDRKIPAGQTAIFSYLIGVGDVTFTPENFVATPDDAEAWNDLSLPHQFTLEGTYTNDTPGKIQYAVEDSEEWTDLTGLMQSGTAYSETYTVTFTPGRDTHSIRFRALDAGNNVIESFSSDPIIYKDVSFHEVTGIQEMTYDFGPLEQTGLSCSTLESGTYEFGNYRNNVNVGIASFSIEGKYPYTIGRKYYSFKVNPQPLEGELLLTGPALVFTSQYSFKNPQWAFSEEKYKNLVKGQDYELPTSGSSWEPGTYTWEVKGKWNLTGSLYKEYEIQKANLSDSHFSVTLPGKGSTYNAKSYEATFSASGNASRKGMGDVVLTYKKQGEETSSNAAPSEIGTYDVYLLVEEGKWYKGRDVGYVGSFTIYEFDADEWKSIQAMVQRLEGLATPWPIDKGIEAVSTFKKLTIEEGHVVRMVLSNQQLTETFPVEEMYFPHLTSLDLKGNKLTGDLSAQFAALVEKYPGITDNITYLNLDNNKFTGNVGLLAQCCPNLTELKVSYNCFEEVSPVISSKIGDYYLNLKFQTIDRVVELNMSDETPEWLEGIPTMLRYNHKAKAYNDDLQFYCSADDWLLVVEYKDGAFSVSYLPSPKNAYYGNSGDIVSGELHSRGSAIYSTFKVKLLFDNGDANFINGVNAEDLQATILYVFDEYTAPFNFTAANTYDKDEVINVQDVVCTANLLLATPAEVRSKSKDRKKSVQDQTEEETDAAVYIRDGKVILNTRTPIAALDIKACGQIYWDVAQYGMTQSTKESNLVGYSLSGATLPIGEIVIGTCAADADIRSVSLADSEAKAISVSYGENTPTSITGISGDSGIHIYDLSGRKQRGLKTGVNIVNKNGKTIKVINK